MAEAAECWRWDHTAALLQMLHNVNCAKSADRIEDRNVFNPVRRELEQRRQKDMEPEEVFQALKGAFLGKLAK